MTSDSTEQDWEVEQEEALVNIARLIGSRRTGFLIGAGTSRESGGIDANQLALRLVQAFLFKRSDSSNDEQEERLRIAVAKFPLEAIADACAPLSQLQSQTFQDLLLSQVFPAGPPLPHEGHVAFASLVSKFLLTPIYTTNWDDLLERAIGDSAQPITERTFPLLHEALERRQPAVVHLHGTFADSPLIGESDLLDLDRPLHQLFLADLMTKTFVFVGYSMFDPAIRQLYTRCGALLARRSERLLMRTYVVSPCESPEERRLAARVWSARGAQHIPMSARDFFIRLRNETISEHLTKVKQNLARRLIVSAEVLDARLKEYQDVFPAFQTEEQVVTYLDSLTDGV